MKKYKASEKVGKLEYIREQHTTNINLLEAINFFLTCLFLFSGHFIPNNQWMRQEISPFSELMEGTTK